MQNIFYDIGLIIIIATVFAYLARLLNQPLIPAYVLTGLIIGPFLGLITNTTIIFTLSEIGIAFLLFIVGLEMDIRKLKNVGLISSLGGVIQMLTIFTFAFIIAMAIGFIHIEAVYIGIIIAFSSTMVVVKLLSDKKEIDTLHGRIIIGILLMQDIFAILALSILATLNDFTPFVLLISLLKGVLIFLIAIFAAKFIFPLTFKFAAKNQELLFLLAITVLFTFSLLFNYLGFSIAIGAFVAGITLANLPYNIEIIGKVKSLKDFFATIFFVSLGMQLLLGSINLIVFPLILFLLFIIFLKPLITMFICSFFGYKKRTSFLTSISLAQISEFSLIIVAQGLSLGHIGQNIFSLTVLSAIITIVLTSYFIKYEDNLYLKLANPLKGFDRFTITEIETELEYINKKAKNPVIICGYNRIGYSIVKTLKRLKRNMLIVDFNPEVIKQLIKQKIPCVYGDVGDSEILERLNLKKAPMIVSTVPTKRDNLLLIKKIKETNSKATIFVTASQVEEALELYDAGADYVIMPHFLGGDHVSVLIQNFTGNMSRIIETKLNHIKELKERRELGHEHPAHK